MTNSLWDSIVSWCWFCFHLFYSYNKPAFSSWSNWRHFFSSLYRSQSLSKLLFLAFFSELSRFLISFKILTLNHLGWFLHFTLFCLSGRCSLTTALKILYQVSTMSFMSSKRKVQSQGAFSRTWKMRLCLGFWCSCSLWYWTCYC